MINKFFIKLFLVIIPFCFFNNYSAAQGIKVEVIGGLGTYSMNDLRLFNDEMEEIYDFDAKTVSDFPTFFYYGCRFA